MLVTWKSGTVYFLVFVKASALVVGKQDMCCFLCAIRVNYFMQVKFSTANCSIYAIFGDYLIWFYIYIGLLIYYFRSKSSFVNGQLFCLRQSIEDSCICFLFHYLRKKCVKFKLHLPLFCYIPLKKRRNFPHP